MARRDFYDDPSAPPINSVVPAVTAFVLNADGAVLMERRSDNGLWGLPGGVHEPGETISNTAIREVQEETGITVRITGLVGIYTDPDHVIAFDDGEVRQEFSLCFRALPVEGELAVSGESIQVRWISRTDLETIRMSQSTRRRIADALEGAVEPVIA